MCIDKKKASGFTLIELMVVMAIISMVMGVSSALFSQFNKRLATQSIAGEVRSMLRLAKGYAVESKEKTLVHINKESVSVTGKKIRGYWHLEEIKNNLSDGFGPAIKVENGKIVPGKIGHGISLDTDSFLDCGAIDYLELGENFSISFAVFFNTISTNERTLFSIGENYTLKLQPSHRLKLSWGDNTIITTASLPLFQWTELEVAFENNTCKIYLNDIVVMTKKIDNFSYDYGSESLIFAKGTTCHMDQIVVSSFVEIDQYKIPEHFYLEKFLPVVTFDETGRLAQQQHLSPVFILVKENISEQAFAVEVSLMANITITEVLNGK